MSTSLAVSDLNLELARKINEEARNDPQSPYAGKVVGIVNGQVMAVASDLDELVQRLCQLQVDLSQALSVEVGIDYDEVQEIWALR
jgi:hypothetical protein